MISACPYLPVPEQACDYRLLRQHGNERDASFYLSALTYAQYLWQQGDAGRALLAATRALYADVAANDAVLLRWPLPYQALGWMMRHHVSDDFPGNPRRSYQHQASRLRGERAELRSARAWAVWALACAARPQLPGDPACPERTVEEIVELLEIHGHPGESGLWREVFDNLT